MVILLCDYILSYSFMYTIIPGVWCMLWFWLALILMRRERPARLLSYAFLYTTDSFSHGCITCNCGYFCLRLQVFLPAIEDVFVCDCVRFCWQISGIFVGKSRQFCMLVAGEFAWVPHIKLPVKYPRYSGTLELRRSNQPLAPEFSYKN